MKQIMNLRQKSFTILPLILLTVLGVKFAISSTSYAASQPKISKQILDRKTEEFLLAAAGTCEVSMPNPETNERLVLNVREVPNGEIVGTVDDGAAVELETVDDIEYLYWVKIIKPIEGYVWTEHLTNCQ